ncbi:hypothetical protein SCUP234_09212 [Seiridium cupressi]
MIAFSASAYTAVTPAAKPAAGALRRSDSCSGGEGVQTIPWTMGITRVAGSTNVTSDLTTFISGFAGHTSASDENTLYIGPPQVEDLAGALTIGVLTNGTTIADFANRITTTLQDLKVTFADNGSLTSALDVATNILAGTQGIATSFLASNGNLTVLLGSVDVISNILGELGSVVQSVAGAVAGKVLMPTLADAAARVLAAAQAVLSSKARSSTS